MSEHSLVTRRASMWLLQSGIQKPSGGVSRFYQADRQQFRPVSNEITGYAAAGLVYLFKKTGERACMEAAVQTGWFLSREAWLEECATMPFEPGAEKVYFFDLGIISRGLLSLWRATRKREFFELAVLCARSMQRDFGNSLPFHPIILLPDKRPMNGGRGWSERPGCYQLKAAMAWSELAQAGCSDCREELFDDLLRVLLRNHSVFLDEAPDRERLMDRLHAYCYFLEGLLSAVGRPDCAQVLEAGIRRVSELLRQIRPVFVRSDVYAQLLRLRLYAAALGVATLDEAAAAEEAAELHSFQMNSPDARLDGAFSFGKKAGRLMPFANPVSTIFAVQAVEMWSEWQDGRFRPDVGELI